MHIDARELSNGTLIEGDICIVGAGAAGISIALQWINTNYKVILLEGGGFSYEDKIQELFKGKTTGQPYYPLQSSRLHYFGGTTGHWAGYCAPMDPIDFTKRDWVENSGWPINKEDLDPFYERAHPVLELGPYDYSFESWQKKDKKMISIPMDQKKVWNKMWQFSPPTRFGKTYKDDIVNAKNIHLYTYANATDIKAFDTLQSVQEITVANHAGKTHTVRAKYFILSCNAIQNPRLLLASNKQFPRGLGNENDVVGRYFMEHLEIKSAELWLNESNEMDLYSLRGTARAELAISPELQQKYRILNGTASMSVLNIAKEVQPAIETWSEDDPRASEDKLHDAHKKVGEKRWLIDLTTDLYKSYELFTRIEQYPNPDCRITLDTEKDTLGVPRAKLHWQLSMLEKRSIRKMYEVIGQQIGQSGFGRVRLMEYLEDENDDTWPVFTGGGWHHMGTTRMNIDPQKGVVDANCKVHSMQNLFIASSSVFPTAGAVNPTLTIVALSIRISDHIKELIKKEGL